jgi:hypothetical protein
MIRSRTSRSCGGWFGWVLLAGIAWLATPAMAADLPTAAAVLARLQSRQETQRRLGIQQVQWGQGRDAEYHQALADLLDGAARRPTTDSAFLAVQKLRQCPLPVASDTLARTLQASDWRLAVLAADLLGERRATDAVDELRACWKRPEIRDRYALRHAVLCSLGDIGGHAAVRETVSLLPQLEGQLQYEAVARLTLRTGQSHGNDAQAWQSWLASTGGRVPEVNVAANEALPTDLPWNRTVPRFFEVPLYSLRVVFVLDRSNSMQSTLNGKTRLETLQEEFSNTLKRLSSDVYFGVVLFNERAERWQPTLVPATPTNKAAAIQFLYSQQARGRTAVYDALDAGLTLDRDIEQLIFLTDGKPTAGQIQDPPTIVRTITAHNLFTRTRIDSLGIDTVGDPEYFLRSLSQENFGTYTKIR